MKPADWSRDLGLLVSLGLVCLLGMSFNCHAQNSTPGASPDSPLARERILFHSNRDGNYQIYSMNPDGAELTRITDDSYNDLYPVLSHDGSKVAFVSDRTGTDNIYVMNSDGSDIVRLTFG